MRIEIHDGMTEEVASATVIYSGQITLSPQQKNFRINDEEGFVLEVLFKNSGATSSRVEGSFNDGIFRLDLFDYNNPGTEVIGGRISGTKLKYDAEGKLKAGSWGLVYTMAITCIGDGNLVRLVSMTIAEARLA